MFQKNVVMWMLTQTHTHTHTFTHIHLHTYGTLPGFAPFGGLLSSTSTGSAPLPSAHLLPSATSQPDLNELLRYSG